MRSEKTKENIKKKTNANFMLVVIILLAIIATSSSVGLYAWAQYRAANSSGASGMVAKWHFDLKNENGQYASESSGPIDLPITRTDGYSHVAEGTLAPGTFGEIGVIVDTTGTEVSLEYNIKAQFTNCPQNLKFYKSNDYTEEQEIKKIKVGEGAEQIDEINISKYLHAKDASGEHSETIFWCWPYETDGGDEQDTKDAGKEVVMNITVTGTQVMQETLPEVTENTVVVKDTVTNEEVVLNKTTAPNYYGREVEYKGSNNDGNLTYRLFYIDYDNKYGDGKGTIYLKADPYVYSPYLTSSESINMQRLEKMNPQWAELNRSIQRTLVTSNMNNLNTNEKLALWLLDESIWTSKYANKTENSLASEGDFVNYAVAAPSIEMYIDSYNETHTSANLETQCIENGSTYGYQYSTGSGFANATPPQIIEKDRNGLYRADSWVCYLASPSANSSDEMCFLQGGHGGMVYGRNAGSGMLSPIVSLKANAPISLK